MAYREVTMIEITEVLRQWLAGAGRKQIARQLGLDPKTVRPARGRSARRSRSRAAAV
jgi:DNA-binding CsgD family transcriptional regulator